MWPPAQQSEDYQLTSRCIHEQFVSLTEPSFSQSNLSYLMRYYQATVVKDPLLYTQYQIQLTAQLENEWLGKYRMEQGPKGNRDIAIDDVPEHICYHFLEQCNWQSECFATGGIQGIQL